jgi:uncharacterized protein YcbK (DUF882 family)
VCNQSARSLVAVGSGYGRFVPKAAVSAGYCGGIAALLLAFGGTTLQNATANGDTRTITFRHIHLKEDTTVTFKVNGRYDQDGLKKINHALRDWRTNEPTNMDPHLIDSLWEVYREVGATEPIHVIGGYRAPATNAMLRRRSSGVAKHSLHMQGKAVDFFIPEVPLEAIRHAGLRLQKGGVGFYPTSGAPFIHMDVGSVRHWPRMPEAQLARVMAKGPLTRVASATATKTHPAARVASNTRDEDESTEVTTATPRSRTAAVRSEPVRTAAAAIVPLPRIKPQQATQQAEQPAPQPSGFQLASASSRPVPAPERPARAASLVAHADISANDIINERGYWQGLVEPTETVHLSASARANAPRPPADIPDVEPEATGSVARAPWPMPERPATATGAALAYAPAASEPAVVRASPMGSTRTAPQRDTTVAVKRSNRPAAAAPEKPAPTTYVKAAQKLNDPWMRAMILSPNAQSFMSTSLFGANDFRALAGYLLKPSVSVMMTFSEDPYLGMSSEHFQGHAVVFVSTVTFSRQTASLR